MQKQWAPFCKIPHPQDVAKRPLRVSVGSLLIVETSIWSTMNLFFFGMEVTSRGPFLRDALIMSRSPSYNVAVSGRSKTLLRCGTRSLQRFGRFGISAGGYSPQTKGVIEFGGWSRESQALFFCFSYISKKKRCFKELHHFCRKVDNAFQDFTHSIFGCTL